MHLMKLILSAVACGIVLAAGSSGAMLGLLLSAFVASLLSMLVAIVLCRFEDDEMSKP
jgi:hypothetical protein